ncbi:MAG: S8 family serine peptidase [Patescibacteria group bacterium]|jgi:hypothetical protein
MMKKIVLASLCLFGLALSFNWANGAAKEENAWQSKDTVQNDQPTVPPQIIIKKTNGDVITMKVANQSDVPNLLEAWSKLPNIEYAEMDGLSRAMAQEESWGYATVQAESATDTNGATGSGIIVAVVDTGVDYNHEDLDANNWENSGETAGNNVDDDGNGYVDDKYGYDFIGSIYTEVHADNDPDDEYGHGTHVSGIIAAENNSVGVRGVASSATIMPVKVLDSSGWGWDSAIAEGIRYAVDNGANIINMSLGGSYYSRTLKEAVDYAETNNVLVVASSGNSATYSTIQYPAIFSNVVSVGASDEDGYKTYYSNWGKVDVMAPGHDILSSTPGNLYASYSGTSMASPHVAGVAALIMQVKSLTTPAAVRHVLETTTSDFGTQAGPDYVTGQGMVNALAATGTLSAETFIYADDGWIKSDGVDDAVLYASVRDAAGAAIVGETVTWSASKGTLSASSSATNASGIASVALTAHDTVGLSTITATPTSATAGTMQIAIAEDAVQPDSIGVTKYDVTYEEEVYNEETDEESEEPTTDGTLSNNLFAPGDQLTIWAYATGYDREDHKVTMSYSVTDPNGNAVTDLSGTSEEVTVGEDYYGYYFPQTRINSKPLTLPADSATGEYTLSITTTDTESLETASRTMHFWVTKTPDILVVYNSGYCSDTQLEGMDFGYITMCNKTGHVIAEEMENLGYEVMLWDTTDLGTPYDTDLSLFPMVIWADAGINYADSYSLQTYLDNGGNLLLTSEETAYNESYSGVASDFLWNYMHARYISENLMPDKVDGISGSMFDGLTYNIDYYDLNGNGVHDTYYANELELNEADDASAIFSYDVGNTTAKTAGIAVDNGTYRSVFLSFGLEAINDGSGNTTKAYMLGAIADYLLEDGPTITRVNHATVRNNHDTDISIKGTGFITTGTTKVKLGTQALSNVTVVSRTKITATIPAGLKPQYYKLKVTNPDGQKDTKKKAVLVKKGGAYLESIAPEFIANHEKQEVILYGNNFTKKTAVYLNKEQQTGFVVDNATQITLTVPKNYTAGTYTVKVKNPQSTASQLAKALKVRVGFTKVLKEGDTDEQVLALEKRLTNYGYFTEDPDNKFTEKTKEALLHYQIDWALTPNGKMDFLTRHTLNTEL